MEQISNDARNFSYVKQAIQAGQKEVFEEVRYRRGKTIAINRYGFVKIKLFPANKTPEPIKVW